MVLSVRKTLTTAVDHYKLCSRRYTTKAWVYAFGVDKDLGRKL